MSIIAILLYSQGDGGDHFHVPLWVVLSCQAAMALGTLMGGWRIVRTMGSRITHLNPMQGICAETGGALTLFAATALGVPVSTTPTITGAIAVVGHHHQRCYPSPDRCRRCPRQHGPLRARAPALGCLHPHAYAGVRRLM